jgi:hypothetical protein
MIRLAVGLHVEHHGVMGDPPSKVVGAGLTVRSCRRRSTGEALPSVAVDGPGGSCSFRRSARSRLSSRWRSGHNGPFWQRRAMEGGGGGNDFGRIW